MLSSKDIVGLEKIREMTENNPEQDLRIEDLQAQNLSIDLLQGICQTALIIHCQISSTYQCSPALHWQVDKHTHFFFKQQGFTDSIWQRHLWPFRAQLAGCFHLYSDRQCQKDFRRFVLKQRDETDRLRSEQVVPFAWSPDPQLMQSLNRQYSDTAFWQETVDLFMISSRESGRIVVNRNRAFYNYAMHRLANLKVKRLQEKRHLIDTVLR